MNKHTKFFLVLGQATMALVLGVVMLAAVPANAQIGMEPFGVDKSDPKATGWFKYIVNPGDTISDYVLITNLGKEDITADLQSNDAIFTEDGAFTIVSNEVEDKQVGAWVKLNDNKVVVPAEKALKVPFKIEIPKDAKAGEYAGGLSIIPIDNSNPNAPLAVKTRIGNRIYIMVKGGDLNVSGDVKDLNIINPKLNNFVDQIRRRNFIKKDNLVFDITSKATGNVYLNLEGSYKLTTPDGKVKESKFTRNLGPDSGERTFYIETNVPYQVGETKLEVNYKLNPQSTYKDSLEYKRNNDSGTLTTSVTMTQDDINAFDKALESLNLPKTPTPSQQKPDANNSLVIQPESQNPANKTETKDNSLMIYIGAGVGVLLLILIGLVGYKIYSDQKKSIKEEKSESKEEVAEKDKSTKK
ncbi:MAG: hypothetical protein OHK0017_03920 [Patescibacteria group bacterium]